MARTTTVSSFSITAEHTRPVAVVNPASQVQVIGARTRLDGKNSYSDDGEELTYAWSFVEVPLGSRVDEEGFNALETSSSVVEFAPDVTGPYRVALTVSTPYRSSDAVEATINVQVVLVPYTSQVTPPGDFMFRVLSDFWRLVDNRQALPVYWSGQQQVLACDLLRAWQVDYAKSIANIQELFQRRWLAFNPRLALDPAKHVLVHGYAQAGTGAFTGAPLGSCRGIAISAREFVLSAGTTSEKAVGTELTLQSGTNAGTYTVNRLNSDRSGYIVSTSTPFPAPAALVADNDLVTSQLSDEVYSATVDLSATSVGDVLRIEEGADSGYYLVAAVGVAGGLANDRTLRIEKALARTRSSLAFSVFPAARAAVAYAAAAYTDTVYIPEDDADFTVYDTGSATGSGTLKTSAEILVERRHVYDSMVGKAITIVTGTNGGKTFVVAAVNVSRTGYFVANAFQGAFTASVTYTIPVVADVRSRLLVLDGQAYPVVSAVLDEAQPSVAEGGRGPLWVVTTVDATVPAGLEEVPWRMGSTLSSEEWDLETLGVSAGDVLVLEVERLDMHTSTQVSVQVIGASRTALAFDLGVTSLSDGEVGAFSDGEKLLAAQELRVPRAYIDEVTGELVLTSVAATLADLFESTKFQRAYWNLPIAHDTDVDVGFFKLRVRAVKVIRNMAIQVDEGIESIPALFEYIAEPTVGEDADGNIILVTKDAGETELTRAPLVLVENRDYSVGDGGSITGDHLETTADSDILFLAHASLGDRGVRPGDTIDIESGSDQGRYVILEVRDEQTLRVLGEDGSLPSEDATGIEFTINRRAVDTYLRFVEGMFTPSSPAPEELWAETTFFDNSDAVEANFGVMVGITRDQLDEYGTAQVTYKGAISALMYAWALGPTLGNVALGVNVLLGLPVTEVPGIVRDVDDAYTSSKGRILVEDVDAAGRATGFVRSYFYRSATADVLDDFAGVAINPGTGDPYAAGDTVAAFTALSRAVIVDDYVKNPRWWVDDSSILVGREVEKYHSWQVRVDAGAVDSRDMALAYDFVMAIRPIYTKPYVSLVLYLVDEITLSDSLSFATTLYQYDDIAFSLESTRMVDDTNGGSLPLREVDVGSFSTRILFEGHDLATEAGSGTVVSARGGFVAEFAGPISDAFDGDITTRGERLVRAADDVLLLRGDILYVLEGLNVGRYEVEDVVDDTTLTVRQLGVGASLLPAMGPLTPDPTTMKEGTEQRFWVERLDVNPVAAGTTDLVAGSDTLDDPDGNFIVDGVAVDDVLVVLDGDFVGRYRVIEVQRAISGSQASTTLRFTPSFPATMDYTESYRVERPALYTNPIYVDDGCTTTVGNWITLPGVTLYPVRTGDTLEITDSTFAGDIGFTARVLAVAVPDQVYLDAATAGVGTATVEVTRANYESGLDADVYYERFCPSDSVTLVVHRPRTVFLAVADGVLTADPGTAESVTDFDAAGVTTDMALQVDGGSNGGVYSIDDVTGTIITIPGHFFEDTAVEALSVLEDDDDFHVDGDTVTSNALTDYAALGILPGDVFVFTEGEFTIVSVVTTTLTLATTTGVGPADYTGRIERRSPA